MYEMKVRSLPNVFTNCFLLIATVHSYNTRPATNNKYYHPTTKKKKLEMSIKLIGVQLWNNLPTSVVERKLKLGRKCIGNAAKNTS